MRSDHVLLAKFHQCRQSFLHGSRIDGFRCELDAFMKIGYQPYCNQCGGCVEQNDIAARASFASEDGPQDGGILCCVAAL